MTQASVDLHRPINSETRAAATRESLCKRTRSQSTPLTSKITAPSVTSSCAVVVPAALSPTPSASPHRSISIDNVDFCAPVAANSPSALNAEHQLIENKPPGSAVYPHFPYQSMDGVQECPCVWSSECWLLGASFHEHLKGLSRR